jgi:hypothetical protein
MIALQNMRMSCNSTYLLDQTTDFGVKADELMTLLDEMYERPGTKVVIFSQWQRTHELLDRRMEARGHDRVLFHGGVPGPKRKELVDRFRQDDRCRAFLSTDAGGVGLNLQHASVVVNMDLPWNPAVMEQRIGRVHRMGQSRPVQVVNFISQGTIEEGMLSVLKFKKSLFAGALDGGDREVFLGGSRLNRFMETVEQASSQIPAPPPAEPAAEAAQTPTSDTGGAGTESAAASDGQTTQADVWSGLLQTGLSFLEKLATAARDGGGRAAAASDRPGLSFVRRDATTGQPYLHVPMPQPEVLDRFLAAAGELLGRIRG